MVDVSFDLDPTDPVADGTQEPESRQMETYSCGHTVVGPRLSSADQDAMTVERRTSDETVVPPVDPSSEEDALDEVGEESFPASDPPSSWAREPENE